MRRAKALFWAGVGQWAKAHFSAGSSFLAECLSPGSASLSDAGALSAELAVAGKRVPRAKALFLGGGETVG